MKNFGWGDKIVKSEERMTFVEKGNSINLAFISSGINVMYELLGFAYI